MTQVHGLLCRSPSSHCRSCASISPGGLPVTSSLGPRGDGDDQPQDQHQHRPEKTETVGIFVAAGRDRSEYGIADHEMSRNVQRGSRQLFPFRRSLAQEPQSCADPPVGEWIGLSECFSAGSVVRQVLHPVWFALTGLFYTGAGALY